MAPLGAKTFLSSSFDVILTIPLKSSRKVAKPQSFSGEAASRRFRDEGGGLGKKLEMRN